MANTLKLLRGGAVGFIGWLEDVAALPLSLSGFKSNAEVMRFIADDRKVVEGCSISF